jgi:hypothetical protein
MENPTFTKACLSDVRVIMAIMLVPMVERPCQMVMERISALKYLLSGVHVAMSHCVRYSMSLSLEDPAPAALHGTEKPLGMIARARVHSESGHMEDLQWVDRW